MHHLELTQEFKETLVRVVDHEVECEELKHELFIHKDRVTPSPVFLALLVDNELGILLGDSGHGDDNIFRLSAVLFRLVCEEQGGCGNVLKRAFVKI
jgi:hypothetical protein